LKVSGHFYYRMEAKDGHCGFDFMGAFKKIVLHKQLSYKLEDLRLVEVSLTETTDGTTIKQQFEAERTSLLSKQKSACQAIMNSFRSYSLSQIY